MGDANAAQASTHATVYSKTIHNCLSNESLTYAPYVSLASTEVSSLLDELAHPYTIPLHSDVRKGLKADGVNFQPCKASRTMDRYVVEQIEVSGRVWTLTGVFDGHLGEATVEHVVHHLPLILRHDLSFACSRTPGAFIDPELIASIFRDSIRTFDDSIAADVINLFPGGKEKGLKVLDEMDDDEVRRIVNDYDNGLVAYAKAKLCMYGTTALIALVDERQENLWVANLGDCQAVLATQQPSGRWTSELLSTCHNGSNPHEIERVLSEHTGEPECILKRRILGALAPFRAIGDHPFKQPPEFTRRILYNLEPTYADIAPWEAFLLRNLTPPYISNEAEVIHRRLGSAPSNGTTNGVGCNGAGPRLDDDWIGRHFLVLSTDGLADLYDGLGVSPTDAAQAYVDSVAAALNRSGGPENLAKHVLWDALGGEDDSEAVSKMMTVESDELWMDDTTVVVQLL